MAKENARDNYLISQTENGEIRVAEDVVSIIAGLAATEVEGVAAMSGNITHELVSKLGVKNLQKGIRLAIKDGKVTVDVSLVMAFGYSVPEVSQKVQEKVRFAVETMTGLEVVEVNIQIAGVNI